MADHSLRRSKSLKDLLTSRQSKRELPTNEDVPTPLTSIAPKSLSSSSGSRQGKQTLVQFRITADSLAERPDFAGPAIPVRTSSRHNTWPMSSKERKPGTYVFDVTPTLTRTPWEHDRSLRTSSLESERLRAHVFEQLPSEILHCVSRQLRDAHSSGSMGSVKELRHDLRALSLTNKRCAKIAQEHLYREIFLPADDEVERNRYLAFRKPLSRLKQLLRTLQEVPKLSDLVRHLRITRKLASQLVVEQRYRRGGKPSDSSSAIQLIANIVSICQNLEHFTGDDITSMNHTESLTAALSSLTRLKSLSWTLPSGSARLNRMSDLSKYYANMQYLETLIISRSRNWRDLQQGAVGVVLQRLPSLKHLAVKGLTTAEFHNGTLLMLPPLDSLRLEGLHGVTDRGLEQLAVSRLAFSLKRLTLCGLELTSLRTVQALLQGMPRLRSFKLQQDTSLELQQWFSGINNSFALASDTLEYVLWDVLAPGSSTAILANSIAAGKFPSLRTVCAPCDYDGVIQSLCRPIEQEPVTVAGISATQEWERATVYHRSLLVSQTQAQVRVRKSRRQPSFDVVVQDTDECTQEMHVIGSYLGSINSKIKYSLDEAVEGQDAVIAEIDQYLKPTRLPQAICQARGREQVLDAKDLF